MAKGYNALEGSPEDVSRRLLRRVDALEKRESGESAEVTEIKEAIGKASGQGAGGILKDVKDIQDAIGDEETEGTILARIKALEDAK